MIAIFKNNEFVTLSDNQDEINKYKINPDYMLYEVASYPNNYNDYDWFLDINNNVKYFLNHDSIMKYEIEIKDYIEAFYRQKESIIEYEKIIRNIKNSSFMQRLKYLFTGKLPCH